MKETKIIIYIIIIAVSALIIYFIVSYYTKPGKYDEFAKCLAEKGATMYGTDWCKFCQGQKASFGKSFKFVNYTNCDFNREECNSAGIKGYPTWVVNEKKYSGKQQLDYLASLTNCSLQ